MTVPPGNAAISTLTPKASRGGRASSSVQALIPGKLAVAVAEDVSLPWAAEILRYLKNKDLPEDDRQADRIVRQASLYCLIDGELYRKRECRVKLRCIPRETRAGAPHGYP